MTFAKEKLQSVIKPFIPFYGKAGAFGAAFHIGNNRANIFKPIMHQIYIFAFILSFFLSLFNIFCLYAKDFLLAPECAFGFFFLVVIY